MSFVNIKSFFMITQKFQSQNTIIVIVIITIIITIIIIVIIWVYFDLTCYTISCWVINLRSGVKEG